MVWCPGVFVRPPLPPVEGSDQSDKSRRSIASQDNDDDDDEDANNWITTANSMNLDWLESVQVRLG